MTDPRLIHFPGCTVRLWQGYLETRFVDGLFVPAAGNDDEASRRLADELRYTSTWEMSRDHEICHTYLAMKLGQSFSPVLRGVAIRTAGGDKEAYISKTQSEWEEGLVLAFQRFLRLGVVAVELGVLLARGHDLGVLADEVVGLVHVK